jgi:hypothetical protein
MNHLQPEVGEARSSYRHRTPDLAASFEQEDLDAFAESAERAADTYLAFEDLHELYAAADAVSAAARMKRRGTKRRG